MKIKKILVVYMKDGTKEHRLSLKAVRELLKGHDAKFVERDSLNGKIPDSYSLVVVVGGDGTFLRASHHTFGKQLLLGVNSDPKNKEGFFMPATRKTFQKKFNDVLLGKAKTRQLARLEARLDGKMLPPTLNEIYIGDAKPYRMSYYDLKIGKHMECHRSSGMIIAAPAGSYAWTHSAGGKRLPLSAKKFQVLSREPYMRRLSRQKIVNKVLSAGQIVEIISQMNHGIAVVDSISGEYKFCRKQGMRIALSRKFLNVVA